MLVVNGHGVVHVNGKNYEILRAYATVTSDGVYCPAVANTANKVVLVFGWTLYLLPSAVAQLHSGNNATPFGPVYSAGAATPVQIFSPDMGEPTCLFKSSDGRGVGAAGSVAGSVLEVLYALVDTY